MCLCLLGIALALLVQPSTDFARGVPGLKDSISVAKRHPLHAGVARRAGAAQEDNSGQAWGTRASGLNVGLVGCQDRLDLEEAGLQRKRRPSLAALKALEEDLLLARQQQASAQRQVETAQRQVESAQRQVESAQRQVESAQEQEAMAVRRLARAATVLETAEDSGNATKVQEAERKVQEAERKVQEAKKEIQEAKKEVQEAERKVQEAERKVQEAERKVQEAEVKEAKASGRTKESEAGGVGRFRRPAAFCDSDRCVRF
ncbi:unnamed protein product [Effrenium voratum]|uniref:Uncharacterized protein n=1 Tax=Effrenium voratum TaxID=2562239 RepID=A0AA36IQW6_9DINO|nr:unnamed protein product [Effrenium voratum]